MKVKNLKIGDTIYFLDIKALKIKQGIYLGEIKKFFYGIITQVKINSEDDIIYLYPHEINSSKEHFQADLDKFIVENILELKKEVENLKNKKSFWS